MKPGTKLSNTEQALFQDVPVFGWFAYRASGPIRQKNVFQKVVESGEHPGVPNAVTYTGTTRNPTKYWFEPHAAVRVVVQEQPHIIEWGDNYWDGCRWGIQRKHAKRYETRKHAEDASRRLGQGNWQVVPA